MFVVPVEASPACLPSLRDVGLNHAFADALLDGTMPGVLWCDQWPAPHLIHGLHPYGMSLVWGDAVDRGLSALIPHLQAGTYRSRDEWLQIDPRWLHLDWDNLLGVADGRALHFHRVNLRFQRAYFDSHFPAARLPAGWSLRAMTAAEFDLPGVCVTPASFWPDAASFLSYGGGICAVKDGVVGAMAFASMRFDNCLEIGIETLAPFRGQGLARAVAVGLIHQCLERGIEPVWACRKENTGSFHLSQSLGFTVVYEGPFYCLPKPA